MTTHIVTRCRCGAILNGTEEHLYHQCPPPLRSRIHEAAWSWLPFAAGVGVVVYIVLRVVS